MNLAKIKEDSDIVGTQGNEPLSDETLTQDRIRSELEALEKERIRQRRNLMRGMAALLVFAMLFLFFSGSIRLLGLPSLEFLIESGRLSRDEAIASYKESVVAVAAGDQRGTGFYLAEHDLVVTNEHVVRQASQILLRPSSGASFFALSQTLWPETDLALLEIEEGKMAADGLVLETETLPDVDDTVLLIGNPLGFFNIVNEVTFIGFSRLRNWEDPVLTIRGPVYRGNSGSPILNQDGGVIGVLFATSSEPAEDDGQQIGYVIPAAFVEQLIQESEFSR